MEVAGSSRRLRQALAARVLPPSLRGAPAWAALPARLPQPHLTVTLMSSETRDGPQNTHRGRAGGQAAQQLETSPGSWEVARDGPFLPR